MTSTLLPTQDRPDGLLWLVWLQCIFAELDIFTEANLDEYWVLVNLKVISPPMPKKHLKAKSVRDYIGEMYQRFGNQPVPKDIPKGQAYIFHPNADIILSNDIVINFRLN